MDPAKFLFSRPMPTGIGSVRREGFGCLQDFAQADSADSQAGLTPVTKTTKPGVIENCIDTSCHLLNLETLRVYDQLSRPPHVRLLCSESVSHCPSSYGALAFFLHFAALPEPWVGPGAQGGAQNSAELKNRYGSFRKLGLPYFGVLINNKGSLFSETPILLLLSLGVPHYTYRFTPKPQVSFSRALIVRNHG